MCLFAACPDGCPATGSRHKAGGGSHNSRCSGDRQRAGPRGRDAAAPGARPMSQDLRLRRHGRLASRRSPLGVRKRQVRLRCTAQAGRRAARVFRGTQNQGTQEGKTRQLNVAWRSATRGGLPRSRRDGRASLLRRGVDVDVRGNPAAAGDSGVRFTRPRRNHRNPQLIAPAR
jgi:hypothetical protein